MKFTRSQIHQAKRYCEALIKPKTKREMFYELCFALCSPQTKWSTNVKVNKELQGLKFYSHIVSLGRIERIVRPVRYFRNKARYIYEAKKQWSAVYEVLRSDYSPIHKRKWLVSNIKGLGYKTASHFLRNALGITELAILDTHLLKYLKFDHYPNNAEYLELENKLIKVAEKYKISIVVLDAIIFMKGSQATYLR